MTPHTSSSSNTLSIQAPSTARPIRDYHTYELSEGLPSLPSISATDQKWSTDARFYQGGALDATRLPPSHDRVDSIGSMPYIALPKTGYFAQAFIRLRVDACGTPYLDPVIERTRTTIYQGSKLARPLKKASATSLLGTCDSFGIVGDSRGHERLAAFGRIPRIGTRNDEEEEEWWTPDWAIVSGVMPKGTVRGVLEGCSGTAISADGVLME